MNLNDIQSEILMLPAKQIQKIADGYHTFEDLYNYRLAYNAAFFKLASYLGWPVGKSKRHSDGDLCFGSPDWFIVFIQLPQGQVTNHYKMEFWDHFQVPEHETAPEYDGHSPADALDRLLSFTKTP